MDFKILQKQVVKNQIFIIDEEAKISQVPEITEAEAAFLNSCFTNDQTLVTLNRYGYFLFIFLVRPKKSDSQTKEHIRKTGAELQGICNKYKLTDVLVNNLSASHHAAILLSEGLALANYQFLKYRTNAKKITHTLHSVYFSKNSATLKEVTQLSITIDAIYRRFPYPLKIFTRYGKRYGFGGTCEMGEDKRHRDARDG